jgi:predicted glycoside hydrolase/deacetylase ChbG (UPF0249 family)
MVDGVVVPAELVPAGLAGFSLNMTPHSRKLIAGVGSVAIFLAVLIALGEGKPSETRYLLIHADDAGFSEAVNAATIRGMEKGVVSSASIMVMLPGFDEIADYAIAHPEKDFGVHLVLTAEKYDYRWGPVLGKENVPSLVDTDGSFWRRAEDVAQHAKADEVERELRAQVRRAVDRGIPITHLDHHMWVMLLRPDLLKIYVQLGREFQIPIRLHRKFAPEFCGPQLQEAAVYEQAIEPLVSAGAPMLDFIDGNNYGISSDGKRVYFIRLLRNLKPGFSEFVIHCSANRPGDLFPNGQSGRMADARVFTSPEIQDEIRRLGIQVATWKDLVNLKKAGKAIQ